MADLKWVRDHAVEGATVTDLTSAWVTLGLWGPRARDILASTTSDDMSHEAFPFANCRTIEMGSLRVLASRISYVGDLGWELYAPIEQGAKLWDMVADAGAPHGIVPAGIGVYATTGRLEKCYRAFGYELDGEYDVVEAGMAWGPVKEQDFVGKEAHVRHRESEPAAVLLGQPHRLLDAALLVGADREAEVAGLELLLVRGQHHLAAGQRHALDADEDVHVSTGSAARTRSLSGSNSGVEPATATVTGKRSPMYSTASCAPTVACSGGR